MENELKKKTEFVNVGVLDIRNTGGRDFGVVEMVNVGYILCTPETLSSLKGGKKVNVGPYIDASPQASIRVDPTTFSESYLNSQETPLDVFIFGPLTIKPDVTEAIIERGLARLSIFGGPFICPRSLIGTLQSKIGHLETKTILYETTSVRIVMGKLHMDEDYLHSLKDVSEVIVVGQLRVPEVIPNDLLKNKIKRLHVVNGIMCHEENANTIQSLLSEVPKKMRIIPAGYELIEKPLVLNNTSLESIKGRNLYCTERVQISNEVNSTILDANLDTLISDKRVYCPEDLKEVLTKKVDWLKTRVLLYKGELWLVDDERELPAFAFESLDGVATLVVLDELKIDPRLDPAVISHGLAEVHNLGSIACTPEQMETLKERMVINEGLLVDSTKPKKSQKTHAHETHEDVVVESYVNVNYVGM
jgi:hypothetical protein